MNRKQILTTAAMALAFCAAGLAQAASVTGTATATVITPLTIAETTAMAFGNIAGGAGTGTIVLDTAGSRSATGDADVVTGGSPAAALFTITGSASAQAITVTLTTAGAQLDDAGAGAIMALSSFTNSGLPTNTGTGTETFNVGATLAVGASQAAGSYSTALGSGATYSVTVDYD